MGIRVGECFQRLKRRGCVCEQKKRGEKGGFLLATVEALYEQVDLSYIML